MNTLQTIPVDLIDVGDDFNPRREATVDDGFLASVKAHGILTPILVHPQGSGKQTRYFLVAGVFVDVRAARQSDRYCNLRGLQGWSPNRQLVDTVTRLAEPVLPADIKLELAERQELAAVEHANEDAELRANYASSDLPSRVRSGEENCPNCGNSADGVQPDEFIACACTDEQVIDAAVACPRCGEPECFATCSAFRLPAEIEEPAAA